MGKPICLCVNGVLIKNGCILLLKRNVDPFYGYWHVVGGKVEENETLKQALKREFKEETNLDVEVGSIIDGFVEETPDRIKLIVVCQIISSAGKMELNSENQAFNWFPKDAIPDKKINDYLKYF
jgi:ADP-ribose pyrophosphatase YjhB (NUDIX family)